MASLTKVVKDAAKKPAAKKTAAKKASPTPKKTPAERFKKTIENIEKTGVVSKENPPKPKSREATVRDEARQVGGEARKASEPRQVGGELRKTKPKADVAERKETPAASKDSPRLEGRKSSALTVSKRRDDAIDVDAKEVRTSDRKLAAGIGAAAVGLAGAGSLAFGSAKSGAKAPDAGKDSKNEDEKGADKAPSKSAKESKDKPVKTDKAGYPTYKKDSESAASFRKAFAAARKDGKSTFEWQGRKYNTKVKK